MIFIQNFFIFVGVLFFITQAHSSGNLPAGIFHFDGVICPDFLSMSQEAKTLNEDIKFGNEETFLQITTDRLVAKTKKYSFDRYKNDHCVIKTSRKVTTTGFKLELNFADRDSNPNGKFGQLACNKIPENKNLIKYSFTIQGEKLFLLPSDKEDDKSKQYCSKGLAYLAYSKVSKTEFSNKNRPELSQKEINDIDLIKKNPKSDMARSNYILYLLIERRLEEGEQQIAEQKVVIPKSTTAPKFEKVILDYRAEKNEEKKEKEFNKALTLLALENMKESVQPLVDMGESIKKAGKEMQNIKRTELTETQRAELEKTTQGKELLKMTEELNRSMASMQEAMDPKKMEAEQRASEIRDEQRKEEFKQKYELSRVAKDQYTPTYREYSATDACTKAYAADKTEALNMLTKAYKDFPNSPYVLQEYVILLLRANHIPESEQVFAKEVVRYPKEVSLKILNNYLPKYKTAPSSEARDQLLMDLRQDLLLLSKALAEVTASRSKK